MKGEGLFSAFLIFRCHGGRQLPDLPEGWALSLPGAGIGPVRR
jgi:hypothetical protein